MTELMIHVRQALPTTLDHYHCLWAAKTGHVVEGVEVIRMGSTVSRYLTVISCHYHLVVMS